MAKQLKDILKQAHDTIKGVRPSTTTDLSLGKDPGVDYDPKAKDEQDFVAKHSVQKFDDVNGNGADVFQATNVKHSQLSHAHGYKAPKDKKVNEESFDEAWIVTHKDGKVTTHAGQKDAMKASRTSPGSKVSATHGAMGQKAHDVLAPHQKRSSNLGTFSAAGYTPPEKKKKVKEETDLDEAVKTGNEGHGFHGEAYGAAKGDDKMAEAGKAYAKAHSLVKKHAAEHLKDVKNPNKMVKHYLDSQHGRHLHGNEHDAGYVKKDFGHFKKKYKPHMHEEVEQIDELSKKTMTNYIDKALKDKRRTDRAHGYESNKPLSTSAAGRNDHSIKQMAKSSDNRHKGIMMAAKKLAKEEVEQIDELSKKTLGSYIKKAGGTSLNSAAAHALDNNKKKAIQRAKGVEKAADKLTKEETQIDEVLTKKEPASAWIRDFIKSKDPKFAGKSKKERQRMALGAYYAKQRNEEVQEDLAMPLLGGMDDESAEMAKAQLKALAAKANALADQMSDDLMVEPWVQSKIAIAKDYVTTVHDYMTYGEHGKDKENEQTGPDTPMTFPGMSVDVNTGRNV